VTRDDLMIDGLSPFDLEHMTEIIRGGHGTWFHARLLRAMHDLAPHADATNTERLRRAFPGTYAAYALWYNDPGHHFLTGETK
jgi:hypothetical protein